MMLFIILIKERRKKRNEGHFCNLNSVKEIARVMLENGV